MAEKNRSEFTKNEPVHHNKEVNVNEAAEPELDLKVGENICIKNLPCEDERSSGTRDWARKSFRSSCVGRS